MNGYKDGWHIIRGFDCYVEDGKVLRGTKGHGAEMVPAYPYKATNGGYLNAVGVKATTFARSELYVLL